MRDVSRTPIVQFFMDMELIHTIHSSRQTLREDADEAPFGCSERTSRRAYLPPASTMPIYEEVSCRNDSNAVRAMG